MRRLSVAVDGLFAIGVSVGCGKVKVGVVIFDVRSLVNISDKVEKAVLITGHHTILWQ